MQETPRSPPGAPTRLSSRWMSDDLTVLRDDEGRGRSRFALVLALVPPVAIWSWVVISTSGLGVGPWATVGMGFVVMGAIWLAQDAVSTYRAAATSPSKVPDGLAQFTVGFLRFHAQRARWPALPFVIGVAGLLALAWFVLMVAAFVG